LGYEEEIKVLRDRINEIDAQLVPLFEARMRAVDEVAAVKQKYGMPVYDAAREAAVIEKALGLLQDASYADSLRKLSVADEHQPPSAAHPHQFPAIR